MENNCKTCGLCGSSGCADCENEKILEEIETPDDRVLFTREMRRDYTLLLPSMLPIHFQLFAEAFRKHGYKVELLENESRRAVDCGVKYVHNDACYPAICVIGQFIDALQSGKYDTNRVAMVYMQTGGGCRASNYVSLMRKAFARAGFAHVPVVTVNVSGLEKHPGFKVTLPMYKDMLNCCLYGDTLMLLRNQCRVREVKPGASAEKLKYWIDRLRAQIASGKNSYPLVRKTLEEIVADFETLERRGETPVRVGIVGEIYVKYAALGNNGLEEFLSGEGAEVVVPGLLDFCYYCLFNNILDFKFYSMRAASNFIWKLACRTLEKRKDDMNGIIGASGKFYTFSGYKRLVELQEEQKCVSLGMKMGEGWLLTTEMLELCEMGVKNVVCTQPFGCLPNHIVGKGMMRPVKDRYPDANIVAIDYDPGASVINQENRIKLMLSNAQK